MLLMEKKTKQFHNRNQPKYVLHTGKILYKGKKIIVLHSYSRPFSEFLGHGCYMCCLLEIEKEKKPLSRMEVEFISRPSGFMGT